MLRGLWIGLSCWLLCFSPTFGQPRVTRIAPAAAQPGATVEWTLHGEKLGDPLAIWTSFPAQLEIVPTEEGEPKTRLCRVTLDPSAVVGIGGIVVANAQGVSPLALLMLDDVPTTVESDTNHTLAEAQTLTLPAAIDGVASGSQADYFGLQASAGQRVAVEVVAARLGSDMDPVLRLLDQEGNELLFADDDESLGADCRFEYQFEKEGTYLLELRDNRYRSGGIYRLRVGDFPLVSVPYPLGGRLGSTARFQFAGADGVQPIFLRLPEETTTSQLPLAARFPEGKSSSMTHLAASRLPELIEQEPNDAVKAATLVTLPCAMNGRLAQRRDEDCFTFAATKDQRISFRAVARSLGAPTLLYMQLRDSAGKTLAETPVDNSEEFMLHYTIGADGMYCLAVRDLLWRGGPEFAYRVEARPSIGFQVRLKQDQNTTLQYTPEAQQGAVQIPLEIVRQGYDGPIDLRWEDATNPLRLLRAQIPEKAKEHNLIVAAPPSGAAGALLVSRLVARATTEGQVVETLLDTESAIRSQIPAMTRLPGWLEGLLAFATISPGETFFGISPESPEAAYDRAAGTATITLNLQRTNKEFTDPITVEVSPLPDGFSSTVENDKDVYRVKITGPQDVPPGARPVRIMAFGQLKGRGQVVSQTIELTVPPAS